MNSDYIEMIVKDAERAGAMLRERGLSVNAINDKVRVYFPDSKDDKMVVPAVVDALSGDIIEFTNYYDGGFTKLGKGFTEKIINKMSGNYN